MQEETLPNPGDSETPNGEQVASDALLAVRRGIEPYAPERKRIVEFLARWKSEHDYDAEFGTSILEEFRAQGLPGEALMLGGFSGYGTKSWWIDLLQHMVFTGEVKQKEVGGVQFYSANMEDNHE